MGNSHDIQQDAYTLVNIPTRFTFPFPITFDPTKNGIMSLLHKGRRITVENGTYSGPARQGPVRYISKASLTLDGIYTQDRNKFQKSGAANIPDPSPAQAAKGKPRLLLMGQRRSGKSSISSVVFHKMPPNETLFLESTARIQKDPMQYEPPPFDPHGKPDRTNTIRSSFMDFQVWDFPGQLDFLDPQFDIETIFGETGALIWVIDAQDEYLDAIARLNNTILNLQRSYPLINIEVFIHKVDGLSDDYRQDIQRDIMQRIQDELSDSGIENAPINFHLTSIYNHSIFEAFSKVIQKLIPHLPTLEALLNDLCRNCRFEKAYLFDVLSKIYIATDSSPVDMPSYEICSDYIDVVVDISEIYGWERSPEYIKTLEGEPWNKPIADQLGCAEAESCIVLKDGAGDKRAGINVHAGEVGGRPVILREVNKYLALVAVMREGSYAKMPAVGLNIESVCEGLKEVFEITKRK